MCNAPSSCFFHPSVASFGKETLEDLRRNEVVIFAATAPRMESCPVIFRGTCLSHSSHQKTVSIHIQCPLTKCYLSARDGASAGGRVRDAEHRSCGRRASTFTGVRNNNHEGHEKHKASLRSQYALYAERASSLCAHRSATAFRVVNGRLTRND